MYQSNRETERKWVVSWQKILVRKHYQRSHRTFSDPAEILTISFKHSPQFCSSCVILKLILYLPQCISLLFELASQINCSSRYISIWFWYFRTLPIVPNFFMFNAFDVCSEAARVSSFTAPSEVPRIKYEKYIQLCQKLLEKQRKISILEVDASIWTREETAALSSDGRLSQPDTLSILMDEDICIKQWMWSQATHLAHRPSSLVETRT